MMKERLLNYTNDAILALNDDNETAIQENLVQIQNTLIKAMGKPVVIVPAPAFDIDSEQRSVQPLLFLNSNYLKIKPPTNHFNV